MSKILFVTATGTDIGKTFIVEKFCNNWRQKNEKYFAIKPIASGFNDADLSSDTAKILRSLGLENNLENINKISPWRFKNPLSPNIAANLENTEIAFDLVVNFCQKNIEIAKKNNSHLLIEGAGGVMTPINNSKNFLDLISVLKIPVILVTANYLGTISHTLTAFEALKARGVVTNQVIFNCQEKTEFDDEVLDTLKSFLKIDVTVAI